jgi:hypothetical protein
MKTWKYGGEALYFRDPDGHLLEVVTRVYGASNEILPRTTVVTSPFHQLPRSQGRERIA